jgi:glutamate/tyrosine decarboxylase-like PLP-dependent enzyme
MNFALDSATRRKLGYQLIDQIDAFFSSLPDRPVQLPAERRTYGPLSDSLPEGGEEPEKVLAEVCARMVEEGFHVPSANYFGLMKPTPTYMGVVGEALVAALNPQLATLARSQLASKIELETVRWVGERVGWSGPFSGTFTSGGNEANFSGMAMALAAKFPQAVEDGVASIGARAVAYASAESHHSLDKSAGLLGIGRKGLRRIPVNARLQLDCRALEEAIRQDLAAGARPFSVIATAGTTNCGTVDELEDLSATCHRHGLWLHVDGAYGAAAIFSDAHRHRVRGIELADSITIDPHKWLAMPFAAGIVLTCHPEVLERAFSVAAPYMPKAEKAKLPDNSRISAQWTRRMNSLKLWITLRVHGRKAYEELIGRQMGLAMDFAEWVRASDSFELVAAPTLPIVAFQWKHGNVSAELRAAIHNEMVEEITGDGRRWISETQVNGRSAMRMMVISYLTEERHLRELETALERAAKRLSKETADIEL